VHRRITDEIEARGPFFAAAFARLRDLNRLLDGDYHLNLGHLIFRQAHNALGGRLKLAVSGGAALPQRVAQFFNDLGLKLLEGYGLTETAPVAFSTPKAHSISTGGPRMSSSTRVATTSISTRSRRLTATHRTSRRWRWRGSRWRRASRLRHWWCRPMHGARAAARSKIGCANILKKSAPD